MFSSVKVMKKQTIVAGVLPLLLASFYTYSFFAPVQSVAEEAIPETVESVNEIEGNILSSDGETYGKPVSDLEMTNIEAGSPMELVTNLQKEIEKIENEKKEIIEGIKEANKKIGEQKKALRENEQGINNFSSSLSSNLKWLHFTQNNKSLMMSLLNTNNMAEFLVNYARTEEMIELQDKQIESAFKNRKEIDDVRNDIVNQKHLYIGLLSQLEDKEKQLVSKHNELAELMSQHKMTLASQTLHDSEMLRNFKSKYSYSGAWGKGMIIPVSNYTVTSEWGDRVHPIFKTVKHHAGVDLGVDYGTPIRAAANGVVTKAEWYGGYGKTVMLDHGNAISSLYGHNQQIMVKEGQYVRQGEIIALAGSTGNSTGPHCHFEVRQNNNDIDPYTFIQR